MSLGSLVERVVLGDVLVEATGGGVLWALLSWFQWMLWVRECLGLS